MKTVLFVPGYQEDLTTRDYSSVIAAIESKGYTVEFVPIQWKRTTIVDWEAELNKVYEQYSPDNTILAGFSFGSMTAFAAASHRNPSELWLFSLSPYFSDDLVSKNMKQVWLDEIGKHRVEAFSHLDFITLSAEIKCPVKLFIGSKEITRYKVMGERFEKAEKTLSNCASVVVDGVAHDVADPRYRATISENI